MTARSAAVAVLALGVFTLVFGAVRRWGLTAPAGSPAGDAFAPHEILTDSTDDHARVEAIGRIRRRRTPLLEPERVALLRIAEAPSGSHVLRVKSACALATDPGGEGLATLVAVVAQGTLDSITIAPAFAVLDSSNASQDRALALLAPAYLGAVPAGRRGLVVAVDHLRLRDGRCWPWLLAGQVDPEVRACVGWEGGLSVTLAEVERRGVAPEDADLVRMLRWAISPQLPADAPLLAACEARASDPRELVRYAVTRILVSAPWNGLQLETARRCLETLRGDASPHVAATARLK